MADADPSATLHPAEPMTAGEISTTSDEERQAKRKLWLGRLALGVVVAGLLYGLYWLLFLHDRVSTDNAYVNAEMAVVTPQISAQVIEVGVTDTQAVRRGQILARLDPSDARIAVDQAAADLAEAQRKFRQTSATSGALAARVAAGAADITQAQAQLASAEADLEKARVDLARRQALAGSGAVSGEELTAARKSFDAARAGVAQARATVIQAQSSRSAAAGELAANEALHSGATVDTDPAVLAAKAKLEAAQLDLDRTVVRAPVDGIVTKRQVQVGQQVAQGTPIMTIVPVAQVYVDANFKERQLRTVKVGQPATVTADIYGGGVVYHGRVVGLAGGTGSSMALIPAQNATGNWIKVVQRLPVRIALDPRELAAHPLRVGLSTEVEIDVSGH